VNADTLKDFLVAVARDGCIALQDEVGAAERFGCALREVESTAFEVGLLPERYRRNGKTISISQQAKLLRCTVAVIGCGGLGGYVLEELARLGVGTIRAIDPDVFEEHNLNRQILSTTGTIGQAKVEVARRRIAEINPVTEVVTLQETFSTSNSRYLLQGAHVVVDGLDSINARMILARACTDLDIPLIHGSIAGWYGQVVTQFPGDGVIERLYSRASTDRGVEVLMGNPAFTPAVVASLQSAEACKVLLGEGKPLQNTMLFINLLDMDIERIVIPTE
jgi:molybdopterin-synthase adenylyltransferase